MNKLKIIACVDKKLGIGYKGELLYHSKKDMEYFKRLTMGRTVVMGRKTWESLGCKPLKHRNNVIISKKLAPKPTAPIKDGASGLEFDDRDTWLAEDTWAYGSVEEFLDVLRYPTNDFNYKKCLLDESDIYVIGGGKIYRQLLPYCDTLYLTEVDAEKEADRRFPRFSKREFKRKVITEWEEDGLQYKLVEYTRIFPVNDKFTEDDFCE